MAEGGEKNGLVVERQAARAKHGNGRRKAEEGGEAGLEGDGGDGMTRAGCADGRWTADGGGAEKSRLRGRLSTATPPPTSSHSLTSPKQKHLPNQRHASVEGLARR